MKAIPRKTKPKPVKLDTWSVPVGAPMGYAELRYKDRKLATVRAVDHYRIGKALYCRWEFTVFAKTGAAMTTGKRDSELAAREVAEALVERLNRAGLVG